MAASKKIVETHYGRNIGFTRAVDELNIIRNGAMARIRKEIRCPMPDIALKRLTEQQIDDARNGNLSHWGIETRSAAKNDKQTCTKKKMDKKVHEDRKKKDEKVPVVKRYNLRKR